uniref:Metalloendopeptidase n=1 Tax=Stomoxys calcitrans TaxID=35570 RepID=A0A1I8P8G4_STOCA
MILPVLRNGALDPALRWPNATVFYKIADYYNEAHVANIKLAMSILEEVSCVRFYEANATTKAYLNIVSVITGCNSMVGYSGGIQRLNLGKDQAHCSKPLIIVHELLHALGFYHEHMATDRDDYIVVNWENIVPGKEQFFRKLDNETVTDFGVGYDYESIMHYGRRGFSANRKPTITPLDPAANIGQRDYLSMKDIAKLNAMYNCTEEQELEGSTDEEEVNEGSTGVEMGKGEAIEGSGFEYDVVIDTRSL